MRRIYGRNRFCYSYRILLQGMRLPLLAYYRDGHLHTTKNLIAFLFAFSKLRFYNTDNGRGAANECSEWPESFREYSWLVH